VLILPSIDKANGVNLHKNSPGWKGLSRAELDEKIKAILLSKI
jgi:hypothetical protein